MEVYREAYSITGRVQDFRNLLRLTKQNDFSVYVVLGGFSRVFFTGVYYVRTQ